MTFALTDLAGNDCPGNLPEEADLILCRNVLSHLAADYRQQTFDTFARRLSAQGWLLLGDTEVDGGPEPRFALHDPAIPSLFRPCPAAGSARTQPVPPAPALPHVRTPVLRSLTERVAGWMADGDRHHVRQALLAASQTDDDAPDLHLALAYVAVCSLDPDRAVTSLRRALLHSQSPPVRVMIQALIQSRPSPAWPASLIDIAAAQRTLHDQQAL